MTDGLLSYLLNNSERQEWSSRDILCPLALARVESFATSLLPSGEGSVSLCKCFHAPENLSEIITLSYVGCLARM